MERRTTAATRYAEAIFQIGRDTGSYELWLRELGEVSQVLSDQLAAQVMASPVIPRDRKRAILSRSLPDLSEAVQRFLELLIRHERLMLVPRVLERLKALVDEARGLETARVTTAVPLGAAERQAITARLSARSGKQVQLEEHVDPSVIGGVIAQIGDEIIDGSIRGRLERLRRVLAGVS